MELGRSTSSELPLGLAARPRRVGTSESLSKPTEPSYGQFAVAGLYSKPEPPTNFLNYMNFLAEHKHEVPVFSSVSDCVDKDCDKIGSGATFSVYKGSWGEGRAAFKYLKDDIIPQIAERQDVTFAADDWQGTRRKREYESAMKSLMFEIKLMAKRPLSHHRNIIRLLGISWDEDEEVEQPTLKDPIRPVLIVELAWEDYPDLASYASYQPGRSRCLTAEEAVSIAADVADGLAALHSFGVVHGDLKPANVLLFLDVENPMESVPGENRNPRLVAKIGDFGYSGTVSSEDDVRGGTRFWNAPECLDSCDDKEMKESATHQSRDIYSFGLLLVYLWTDGGSPFDRIATDLAAVDRAKLDDRVSDHCRTLVRQSKFSKVMEEVAVAVESVARDTLYLDPRLRCSTIGGVRLKLTGRENTKSIEEIERFTRATFFSIRVAGAPEPMSYEDIAFSNFWHGSEKQIPESRKRLLRCGVELEYIYKLTKPERRGLFLAGHAFVNAEREANGHAPTYPRSSIHSDYLRNYPAEDRLRLENELMETHTNIDNNMLVRADTKEASMIIQGLSHTYQPQGILGSSMSLKSCIELNQPSIARLLLHLGQVSVKEDVPGSSFSLLHVAAMFNRPEFIYLLVEHGLDINQRGGKMGLTPLLEAIRAGNYKATLALLDCGADMEAEIRKSSSVRAFTPLEFAILGPAIAPDILALLLERGARYGHSIQINIFGTFFTNGMFGNMLGKSRQLRSNAFNPEHWDEIRGLLLDHGGEEPDDYVRTVGERKIMEAVASYVYWLSHLGTAVFQSPAFSTLLQDMASGSGADPTDSTVLYELIIKYVAENKRVITGYLRCLHTLATVTEHLPVGSVVLTVSFTAHFKNYLAPWRKKVDWDEFIDFIIDLFRYMQDPKAPGGPLPEGLSDADLDSFADGGWNPPEAGSLSPEKRKFLEYGWNLSIPADYDRAMECLLSLFVPELPNESLFPDEAREAFDKLKGLRSTALEDPSARGLATVFNQVRENFPPARVRPTAGGAQHLPSSESRDSNISYQPSFLSDLKPQSPIYICSINTEPPGLRKVGFWTPVSLFLLAALLSLWRLSTWLQWLNLTRCTSLLLLYTFHMTMQNQPPTAHTDFPYLALMAIWLFHDRIWHVVLEYHLIKAPLMHTLFDDPHLPLLRQIRFRYRHGFPDVEPLILSHADGGKWKYDFGQLLEGLHGGYGMLTARKGWIQRADAMEAVLDEWQQCEVMGEREAKERMVDSWGNGWWYFEGDEGTGRWRKWRFVEEKGMERWLPMYARIEELCHSKGRPELYQRFRALFPEIVSGETYRVLEREFAEFPDILEVTQGILFERE
ncbi:MAG: hypothetical protein Q9169_003382 [Polycauliona sp. 2 TL-2023]